eukprot:3932817-Prymnesium_polylepis.1
MSIDAAMALAGMSTHRSMDDALLGAAFPPRGTSRLCFAAAKLDVEGSEVMALLGAAKIFNGTCPPCGVVVEQKWGLSASASPDPQSVRARPVELLRMLGYQCNLAKKADKHYHCVLGWDSLSTRRGAVRCRKRTQLRATGT